MFTLQIQHSITDFAAWQAAFSNFAPVRLEMGVRSFVVRQPVDDVKFVTIDLEFDTRDAAETFSDFLHTKVWGDPGSSPALAGSPTTRILEARASG